MSKKCKDCSGLGYKVIGIPHVWIQRQTQEPIIKLKRRTSDPTIITGYETVTENWCRVCNRKQGTDPFCSYPHIRCETCKGMRFTGKRKKSKSRR